MVVKCDKFDTNFMVACMSSRMIVHDRIDLPIAASFSKVLIAGFIADAAQPNQPAAIVLCL
jgi:hypothetical protein